MYSSIQSRRFLEFYCRVLSEPVIDASYYQVYALVGSDALINQQSNGRLIGEFKHVAIDINGIGYLYDFVRRELGLNMGECDLVRDDASA